MVGWRQLQVSAYLARSRLAVGVRSRPWLDWAFVFVVGGLYFLSYRLRNLPVLVQVFGDPETSDVGMQVRGVLLGMLEDFCLLSYLVLLLWGYDLLAHQVKRWHSARAAEQILRAPMSESRRCSPILVSRLETTAGRCLRFLVFLTLFAATTAFFCADYVLMRAREMRFTVDWITMYINDDGAASTIEIPADEVRLAVTSTVVCCLVAITFALINMLCTDLSRWSPLKLIPTVLRARQHTTTKNRNASKHRVPSIREPSGATTPERTKRTPSYYVVMEPEGEIATGSPGLLDIASMEADGYRDFASGPQAPVYLRATTWITVIWSLVLVGFFLVALPVIALELAEHCEPVVAQIALNTNLNEPFRALMDVEFLPVVSSPDISVATVNSLYLHNATENFTLFADNVLYRTTHGFAGDKAFDVTVDPADPPNVLVLVVESFRHRDSKYLVGNHTYLMGGDTNVSATPSFDRWAARGLAFSNFWSSYRTSRSVESIQFGQLPYDSVTDSGTTGGKTNVELAGLPQFFSSLGYATSFTTGCRTDYDQWDQFLPTHGFDEVLSMNEFKAFAESDLGIKPQDWLGDDEGGSRRAMAYWGVHDDLSFQVLGNLLLNKTAAQQERVARGEPKQPAYMTHYTISSHVPYWEHPKWWDHYEKPDFSALYANATEYGDDIHRYLDLRYFQDKAMGEFLDRMADEGVLNDTIVFIVGDHGQAPENGCDKFVEDAQQSTTHVAAALIAEGRLGDAAGSIFEDAAEHYDLLNTLADIMGVPAGGFMQSGVGRSLLRAVPFGSRVVWSNNPAKKMAAVRGDRRIEYDRESSAVAVWDTANDHNQLNDLYPSLSAEEKAEIDEIRDAGRRLNLYFKERWEKKCILAVEC